jgi:periplasmic divalent cation tolerance protein
LIEEQLAACGNILPRVDSMYRWRGKIESSSEVLVFYKVAAARYAQFEAKLKSLHPYDVPEIVAFGVKEGSPDYLRWVAESCLNG